MTFVDQLQGIETRMSWKIVASWVPITLLGSNTQIVADRRMMAYLLAVNLSSICIATFESLSDDRIKLHNHIFTGFRNMLI